MNLGLYVGSFNPVHKGHINILKELLKSKRIDKALIVPTKNYWDKTDLIDINDRINMLKLYENKDIIIDTERYIYDYTYQVIDSVKEEYKNCNIYLIIGADNLEKFHLWKNVDEILKNKIIILKRDNINPLEYISKFNLKENFIIINDIEEINISSTEIRNRLKNNNNVDDLLDKKVIEYIKDNNLYGG